MKFKYTERAVEQLVPACFDGNIRDAMNGIAPLLLKRADKEGNSYANVAGARIGLRIHRCVDEHGAEVVVIDIADAPEPIATIIDRIMRRGGGHGQT